MSTKGQANATVIVGYCRTPFAKAAMAGSGKAPGHFADIDPLDLLTPLVNTLLEQTGINPNHIEKVLTGVVHQEGTQGLNIARMSVLHEKCNLPVTVTGTSVDMFCASSMEAITIADGLIGRNPESVYLATGVQSMSQVKMGGSNPHANEHIMHGNADAFMDMGTTAKNLGKIYDIDTKDMSAFSAQSHERLKEAQENGHFDNEIVPIDGLDHDDGGRFDTTTESLEELKTKKPGGYAAATSSQITDGASAVIMTSKSYAEENSLPILAEIIGTGSIGVAPEIMGIGPVQASIKALKKAGLTMDDIDFIELNEAFAEQSLSVLAEFNKLGIQIDEDKLNVDGGAIAMGHPLGATGARIVGHVAETLNRENKQYGLATLCVGGGQGEAVVVENPNYIAPKPQM